MMPLADPEVLAKSAAPGPAAAPKAAAGATEAGLPLSKTVCLSLRD